MPHRPLATLLAAAALTLGGCAAYVNIPPQAGDFARHNIDAESIRAVTVPAVRAVVDQRPPAGVYVVKLPEAAQKLTYPGVLPQIGENAQPPFAEDLPEDAPVYEVTGIRVRGASAEVDVVRPGPLGGRQLVTVHMDDPPFAPWTVERIRVWRGPVDAAPPAPPQSP